MPPMMRQGVARGMSPDHQQENHPATDEQNRDEHQPGGQPTEAGEQEADQDTGTEQGGKRGTNGEPQIEFLGMTEHGWLSASFTAHGNANDDRIFRAARVRHRCGTDPAPARRAGAGWLSAAA